MTKVTVSAPGKLMLLGEHAVLFGEPCIVTAVGQSPEANLAKGGRMRATVELTPNPEFILDAPDVQVRKYRKPMRDLGTGEIPNGARFVEQAVKNFVEKYGKLRGGVRISTTSEFSSQFGFGSSSASAVCTIGALLHLVRGKIDQRATFDLAYKTVLDIQGKGSGYDIAAAVFGGTLLYRNGGKVIDPIDVEEMPLIIGYSGQKYETVKVIDAVKERHHRHPTVIDGVYRSIGALIEPAKAALLRSDWPTFGELMDMNQGFLEVLGVSNLRLSSMIHAAREAGAWGAKISGSGKGDCMIGLVKSEKWKAVRAEIEKAGGKVIDIECNAEGLRLEA